MAKKKKPDELLAQIGQLRQAVDIDKLCAEIVVGFGGEEGLARKVIEEYQRADPGSTERVRMLELSFKMLEKRAEPDDSILLDIDKEDLAAALRRVLAESEEISDTAAPTPGQGNIAPEGAAADAAANS